MVAVSTISGFVSLLKDAESCCCNDIGKSTVCQIQLADRLLGKNRENIILRYNTYVAGCRNAESVSQADGKGMAAVALRLGIRKQAHQSASVFCRQRAQLDAVLLFAAEQAGFFSGYNEVLSLLIPCNCADSVFSFINGVGINTQAESLNAFQKIGFHSVVLSYSHDQRFTRAPAPPIIASTSAQLAIEVSPGVVIARAPWAAP